MPRVFKCVVKYCEECPNFESVSGQDYFACRLGKYYHLGYNESKVTIPCWCPLPVDDIVAQDRVQTSDSGV